MSDNEYYSSDYEPEQQTHHAEQDDETGVERKHRPTKQKKKASAQKLEQLKKAREAKRKKREDRLKRPPPPPPPPPPSQHQHEAHDAEPEEDTQTVYVKRPKAQRPKPILKEKPKPRRKKKVVYVEESSSSEESEESSSDDEEVRYIKRRPRKSKQHLPPVRDEPQPPQSGNQQAMFDYDPNGDVVW